MLDSSWIGQHKNNLDTPALILDIKKLKHNIHQMSQFGIEANVAIRPHCKTHKCSRIALLQQEAGAIGISAAKLSEAEVLLKQGIQSVLLTSPLVSPTKFSRLLACLQYPGELILVVDNQKNASMLNDFACKHQLKIPILVDIDGGIGRTGINFDQALEFGQWIHQLPGLSLQGIQCYAGHLQHIANFQERKEQSLAVMKKAHRMRQIFLETGLPAPILTGTGTGTHNIDVEAHVTEIQPGSYVVMDVEYADVGVNFKHAMTLLTSVISMNHAQHVTVDAGTKSIYMDMNHRPRILSHANLEYSWGGFGDEHGKIDGDGISALNLGDVIELIVPHCDPTINLFDHFFIVENERVIDVWPIDMRGKAQ